MLSKNINKTRKESKDKRKGFERKTKTGNPKKKTNDEKQVGIGCFDVLPFMQQKQRRKKRKEREKNKESKESKTERQEVKKEKNKRERERERETEKDKLKKGEAKKG